MRLGTTLVSLLLFCTTAGTATAGSVSGTFKAGKGAIEPAYVVALPVRAPGDALKTVTLVVLSEGPMDASAAVESLDPHTQILNQEGMREANYISFWIRPDGYVGMNATFREGMVQYLDSTKREGAANLTAESLEATFSELSPSRVAGTIRTRKPVKTMDGETYELDVTFDTEVTAPPAGEKLGAGGGAPGKALLELLRAIEKKDWKGLQARVLPEHVERYSYSETDAENFDSVVDMIGTFLPKKKARVVGGVQRPGYAVLEVEGEMDQGVAAVFIVRMVPVNDVWMFDRATLGGFR